MSEMWWNDDQLLVDEVRRAVEATGPVPAHVLAAAKGAYTWRTVDAELALLVEESPLVTMRSSGGVAESLRFSTGSSVVDVDVTADALIGQVDPAATGQVLVEWPDGRSVIAPMDEFGWFSLRPAPEGLVRLRVRPDSAAEFVTEWTNL